MDDKSFSPDRSPGLAKRDQRIKCSSPKKRWGCLADIYSCSTSSRRANIFVKNIFGVILNSCWMMDFSTYNIWFAEIPINLLSGLAFSPACFLIQLCLKLLPLVFFLKIHKFSRYTSFFILLWFEILNWPPSWGAEEAASTWGWTEKKRM